MKLAITSNDNLGNSILPKSNTRDGKPWFVAKDAAEALGYANPSKAIADHCKRAELLRPNDSLGLEINPRGMTVIPESDLYRLIMRSNLPAAEEFQDWIVEEVLPALRQAASVLSIQQLQSLRRSPLGNFSQRIEI